MAPAILSYQRLKWHVLCISSVSQLASSESSNLPFWNPSSFSLCPSLDPPPGGFGALGVEQIPKRPPTIRSSASGRTVNIFQDIAGQRRFHQDPTQHSPRDNGHWWWILFFSVWRILELEKSHQLTHIPVASCWQVVGWWWRLLFSKIKQTWNLSKNLQDRIFGWKNFTHWKRVNRDYFRQH